MLTWLTIDTDDFRHLPVYQGHPTRSNHSQSPPLSELSSQFHTGWRSFLQWMDSHDHHVTLFVITDLLEQDDARAYFDSAIQQFGSRLTFACHGHTHRSWSAWGEDVPGFNRMLEHSLHLLKTFAKDNFLPAFRAPNGYIGPWMAEPLANHDILVDSSINPSWLVRKKMGESRSWKLVDSAMQSVGLIERKWRVGLTLPLNGPALTRFPLSLFSVFVWKRSSISSASRQDVLQGQLKIQTFYCHILDFARKDGRWRPPLNL